MRTPKLQEHKVKHALAKYGVEYEFARTAKNKFGEPILDDEGNVVFEPVAPIKGIFHETGTSFIMVIGDAASVHTKPTPAILTLFEGSGLLQTNDVVTVPPESGRVYKVVSINDIGNLGLFADISLEVLLNGISV